MDKFDSILNQSLNEDQRKKFIECLECLLRARKNINELKANGALAAHSAEDALNMITEASIIIVASPADEYVGEQELQDVINHYLG